MVGKGILLGLLGAVLLAARPVSASNLLETSDGLSRKTSVPAWDFVDLEGKTIRSADLTGRKAVIISFWSMYCQACVKHFSALVRLREKYDPAALAIVSMNTDAEYRIPESVVREFLKGLETREKYRVNYPVVVDPENRLAKSLDIFFLPAIISVDGAGRIIGTYRRFMEENDEEIISGIEMILPVEAKNPRQNQPR
jgi:peroxiredoxin